MTRECALQVLPSFFYGLFIVFCFVSVVACRPEWPIRSIQSCNHQRALQCLYLYRKKARKHDTAFSRHPEMRPRARLTKDLAVRRAEQNQITSFLLRREWQRSWRERILKELILKLNLVKTRMHKLLKQSSSVISRLTVPADSSAYARRAPFVVQCRWHFRHFPRFAGELPARGSLYARKNCL